MAKAGTDLRAKAPFVLKDFQENYWMYKQGYKKEFAFDGKPSFTSGAGIANSFFVLFSGFNSSPSFPSTTQFSMTDPVGNTTFNIPDTG